MRSRIAFACLAAAVFLVACATPPTVSTNPVATAVSTIASVAPVPAGTVVTGLQNAAYNLDMAESIGVLPMSDPADGCVHQALQAIGQDVVLSMGMENPVGGMTAPASYQTKISDLISGGSVAYILAAQAKALALAANGGLNVAPSCAQIVGEFVIKGANAPANAVISAIAGALP